jgi:drug/metabolite transporter (DMT)-like permease
MLAASGQGFRVERRDFWKLLVLGVLGNAVYQFFFIHAISLTTAANTSLILSMSPIFIALLSALLRIERIHWAAWMGILISFFGLYLVITKSNGGLRFSTANFRGDLLILIGTVLWAAYTAFSKTFLERLSPLKFSAVTVVLGVPFYLPFVARDVARLPWAAISLTAWISLVLSALFGLVIGYVIWYYSIQKVGNAKTAIYNNLTPLFTIVFAAVFLQDRIRAYQAVGAAVIFAGVYLTRWGYRVFAKNSPGRPKVDTLSDSGL